ncbi:hypothetical protein SL1157_2536 [Ruegeria lacuscaerulensis ITI-1157]|nr:hypothetical protein SL1157_2536 [Ruegeria lacuscaerulensis ITI-1157]
MRACGAPGLRRFLALDGVEFTCRGGPKRIIDANQSCDGSRRARQGQETNSGRCLKIGYYGTQETPGRVKGS